MFIQINCDLHEIVDNHARSDEYSAQFARNSAYFANNAYLKKYTII